MLKRLLAMMTALLLLPAAVLADDYVPYQVYTFAGSLPELLKEPLSAHIPDEARILSGAAIQRNASRVAQGDADYRGCYSALVLVDDASGVRLLAAAQPEGLPWQINDFTHLLRDRQNASVSIYMPEVSHIPQLSVDYPGPEGLISDLMMFAGNRLWQLRGHIDTAAELNIAIGLGSGTVIDAQGRTQYKVSENFWMDYMEDISAFPTSRAGLEALDATVQARLADNNAANRAYARGANLRVKPTSKSTSLGKYSSGTPLLLLGEQAEGAQFPWLHVLIGDTEGWMSSNYVDGLGADYYPVPTGRTMKDCALYAAPGDKQPVIQLEPGTTFHILTEYKGMYHVCIPRDEISWQVDPDGIYGYISTRNILQGASPSALDALESAR